MIFYLDEHPTKCASYYAVDHLRNVTTEALQVLSDATRVLAEECRVITLERKMRDATIELPPESHFASIERNVPLPAKDLDDPLVQHVVEDQDAWDWMLELACDLIHEQRNWFGHGALQSHIDAAAWLRVNAPRPVNAGRIYSRGRVFPLLEKMPKEFIGPHYFSPDVPRGIKRDIVVRAYRMLYWSKYRNTVQFTKSRRPWWWSAFDRSLEPALASTTHGK